MTMVARFLWILPLAASLTAATVFSTFGPGDSFDMVSDGSHSYDVGGGAFNSNIEDQQASSFVVGNSVLLDSIRVGAFYVEGSNQLTVEIASGATQPGAVIESFSVTNLPTTATIITLDSVLHPLLQAGAQYWIVLTKTDLAGGAEEWSFNDAGFDGRSFMLLQSGVWNARPTGLAPAFEVSGSSAVPEPSSTIFVSGVIGALVWVRARSLAKRS